MPHQQVPEGCQQSPYLEEEPHVQRNTPPLADGFGDDSKNYSRHDSGFSTDSSPKIDALLRELDAHPCVVRPPSRAHAQRPCIGARADVGQASGSTTSTASRPDTPQTADDNLPPAAGKVTEIMGDNDVGQLRDASEKLETTPQATCVESLQKSASCTEGNNLESGDAINSPGCVLKQSVAPIHSVVNDNEELSSTLKSDSKDTENDADLCSQEAPIAAIPDSCSFAELPQQSSTNPSENQQGNDATTNTSTLVHSVPLESAKADFTDDEKRSQYDNQWPRRPLKVSLPFVESHYSRGLDSSPHKIVTQADDGVDLLSYIDQQYSRHPEWWALSTSKTSTRSSHTAALHSGGNHTGRPILGGQRNGHLRDLAQCQTHVGLRPMMKASSAAGQWITERPSLANYATNGLRPMFHPNAALPPHTQRGALNAGKANHLHYSLHTSMHNGNDVQQRLLPGGATANFGQNNGQRYCDVPTDDKSKNAERNVSLGNAINEYLRLYGNASDVDSDPSSRYNSHTAQHNAKFSHPMPSHTNVTARSNSRTMAVSNYQEQPCDSHFFKQQPNCSVVSGINRHHNNTASFSGNVTKNSRATTNNNRSVPPISTLFSWGHPLDPRSYPSDGYPSLFSEGSGWHANDQNVAQSSTGYFDQNANNRENNMAERSVCGQLDGPPDQHSESAAFSSEDGAAQLSAGARSRRCLFDGAGQQQQCPAAEKPANREDIVLLREAVEICKSHPAFQTPATVTALDREREGMRERVSAGVARAYDVNVMDVSMTLKNMNTWSKLPSEMWPRW